jgi:hypothetical protein
MRGKLRDKRATSKKESYSRDGLERRRPYKRDVRSILLVDQQDDEQEFDLDLDLDLEIDEELDQDQAKLPFPPKK